MTKNDWQIYCDCGSNHNGSLDRARQIIKETAALSHATGGHIRGLKFQLFKAGKLWAKSEHSPDEAVVKERELPPEWVPLLLQAGRENKIAVGFTPFDEESLEVLLGYAPSTFFKVSSFDLLRTYFLARCAVGAQAGNHPLHLSTGGATQNEIDVALATVANECPGLAVILYHCVSDYPLAPERARLYKMTHLDVLRIKYQDRLDIRLGWSDHSRNIGVVCRSMSPYGGVVELHLDLDDRQGVETQYGHVWTLGELQQLVMALQGYHDSMDRPREAEDRVDLRADPEDGLRPLKRHRPAVVAVPAPKAKSEYPPYWTK